MHNLGPCISHHKVQSVLLNNFSWFDFCVTFHNNLAGPTVTQALLLNCLDLNINWIIYVLVEVEVYVYFWYYWLTKCWAANLRDFD